MHLALLTVSVLFYNAQLHNFRQQSDTRVDNKIRQQKV